MMENLKLDGIDRFAGHAYIVADPTQTASTTHTERESGPTWIARKSSPGRAAIDSSNCKRLGLLTAAAAAAAAAAAFAATATTATALLAATTATAATLLAATATTATALLAATTTAATALLTATTTAATTHLWHRSLHGVESLLRIFHIAGL